ncbi:MAG: hypothetical protein J0L88_00725 [Xanthomonadales bacterium]|nr:hypothetical protein [Xanthomonadales bacterium]
MNTIGLEIERFLEASSIDRTTYDTWVERRWLVSVQSGNRLSDADAARAMLIRDLRDDLGVNDEGIDLVLQLLDQVHGLRRVLHGLRAEASRRPGSPGSGSVPPGRPGEPSDAA